MAYSPWLALPMWSRDGRTAIRAQNSIILVASRQSWQAGEQVPAEERRDPAVHPGERRGVEARRGVHQFGGEADLSGGKRRERSAVAAVREIDQPLARRAGLEH